VRILSVAEPALTLQMFRGAAREILEAIARSRKAPDDVYAEQWSRLWSLLRLMKSTGPRLPANDTGPWAVKAPDPNRPGLGQWLVGGNLWLSIVLPEEMEPRDTQLATDLPKILNAANVDPPDD
jgi:hypothetical protein